MALQGDKGSAEDKLRLVLVWMLTCQALPSEPDMERVLSNLTTAGADTTAVAYLRRMRSMKLTGGFASPNARNGALHYVNDKILLSDQVTSPKQSVAATSQHINEHEIAHIKQTPQEWVDAKQN